MTKLSIRQRIIRFFTEDRGQREIRHTREEFERGMVDGYDWAAPQILRDPVIGTNLLKSWLTTFFTPADTYDRGYIAGIEDALRDTFIHIGSANVGELRLYYVPDGDIWYLKKPNA